jgi:hypothetical protein
MIKFLNHDYEKVVFLPWTREALFHLTCYSAGISVALLGEILLEGLFGKPDSFPWWRAPVLALGAIAKTELARELRERELKRLNAMGSN